MWRGRQQLCWFVHSVASRITFLPHLVYDTNIYYGWTTFCPLTVFSSTLSQTIPSQNISQRSTLVVFFHLNMDPRQVASVLGTLKPTLCKHYSFHKRSTHSVLQSLHDLITAGKFYAGTQAMRLLIMWFSPRLFHMHKHEYGHLRYLTTVKRLYSLGFNNV
jgi:hypothetical protein